MRMLLTYPAEILGDQGGLNFIKTLKYIAVNKILYQSISQSVTCILIIAVTLHNLLSSNKV